MSDASATAIDLEFRPDSYFWPLEAEKQLLVHIKGAARRAELQRLIDDGRRTEIADFLTQAKLSEEERSAIGRIHPQGVLPRCLAVHGGSRKQLRGCVEGMLGFFCAHSEFYPDLDKLLRWRVLAAYGGQSGGNGR